MANIIGSPFFVRIRLHSAIMPPTVTHSPSFFWPMSASEQSTRARSAGRTSLSGWLERNSPSVSFSQPFSSSRSSGSGGTGRSRCTADCRRPSRPGRRTSPARAGRPAASAGRRPGPGPAPAWCPVRVPGSESSAPHLTSDSIAFLFTARAVHPPAEVPDRGERPALLACAHDRRDGLRADVLDRVEAEADVALHDLEVVARLVHVRGQHLDPHVLALRRRRTGPCPWWT